MTTTSRTKKNRRRSRGASALETALLLAFATLPLISVVDSVQEGQGSRIDGNGDRIGSPTESNSIGQTSSSGDLVTDGSGSTGTTGTTTAFADLTATVTQQGAHWTTTIVMQVTDADGGTGNIVADGVIQGTWTRDNSTFETATCTIDTNGYCVITLKEKKTLVQSAVFRIDSMTSDTAELDPTQIGKEIAVVDTTPTA